MGDGVIFTTYNAAAQPATELTSQFLEAYEAKNGKTPAAPTIMAFASQGKGFFAQYQAGGEYKPTVKAYYTSVPENLRRAKRCVELGEKYGVSATVIALAYLLCHPLRPAAMCTYSKISQYEDSMRALEIPLTAAEVRYLETGK